MTRLIAAPVVAVPISLVLLVSLLISPAAAQLSDWRSIGPDGASILALASQPGVPQIVVAGGYGALFRSSDGGQSWVRGGAGVPVPDVGALHIAADGTVYVGTYSAGVHRSTDGGASFVPANTGMESSVVFVLTVDPSGALWAGTKTDGVFVSTNGGDGWQSRASGLPVAEVNDLLPVGGDSLYAATLSGVYLSTDAGLSWSPRNQDLGNQKAVSLALHPDATYLYAGTTATLPAEESGVYRSSDSGVTWIRIVTGLTNTRVADVLIDPANPDVVFAGVQSHSSFGAGGVFRSTNAGSSWELVPGNPEARDVRVLAAFGGAIFVGSAGGTTSRGGLFRSADGQFFSRLDQGMVVIRCRTVASFPRVGGELLAGALGSFRDPGGAYRSLDGGMSWSDYSTAASPGLNAIVNVVRISSSTRRYAGTASGVWRRSPATGDVWELTPVPSGSVHDLALFPAPADSLRLYAATSGGIFYSSNGGTSFTARNFGLTRLEMRAIAIDPATTTLLYAGTDSAGVFRSTDAGGQWEALTSGLLSLDVRDLTFDGEGRLLAATGGGVFELIGTNWEERNNGLTDLNLRGMAIYRTHRFVATPSGVFRQIGDPTTLWEPLNSGLPALDVRAVLADTAEGRLRLFACCEANGIYMADQPTAVLLAQSQVLAAPGRVELTFAIAHTADVVGFHVERRLPGERDFISLTGDDPLEGGPEYHFVDRDSRLLEGMEVWYRLVALGGDGSSETLPSFPVVIPAAPPPGETPPAPPRLAIFPNPFAGAARLAVTGGQGGVIRILDVGGRNVRMLPVAGDGSLIWDGRNEHRVAVPSGFYFFVLEAPGGRMEARALKLR